MNELIDKNNHKVKLFIFKQITRLERGKFFGEMALNTNKKRVARVEALKNCTFAVLHKQDYNKVLDQKFRKLLDS